jgi:aryl-alcohol dehydrogenase-like predicted oxidoreductase
MRTVTQVPMVNLGSTGLKVSKLGFGTFDFGVPSLGPSPEKGSQILIEAFKLGINFWDTSDDYGSHPHVAVALKRMPREKLVLSTKTSAKSGREAKESLQSSLHELGTDYVDIFLLHFVKPDWIDGSRQVLKVLTGMKTAGMVKALGLSTHSVAIVREAARFAELDVIMAICCKTSQATMSKYRERISLEDGALDDMLHALQMAHSSGKGVVAI